MIDEDSDAYNPRDIVKGFIVGSIIGFLLGLTCAGCTPADKPTPAPIAQDTTTTRNPPIVYWWDDRRIINTIMPTDSTIAHLYEPGPTVEMDTTETYLTLDAANIDAEYIMRISDGLQFECWRVEWCAVGDTCYSPIFFGMIPPGAGKSHLPHSGIIHMRIFGLQVGDRLMIWRSHPWPDSLPSECFETGGRL